MNQSKCSKLIAIAFVIGFIVVLIFQLRAHQPSCQPEYYPPEHEMAGQLKGYPGFSPDAGTSYAFIISGEKEVSDWHSALYMYECRAALCCAKALSIPLNAISVQIACYYMHLFVFAVYASFLMFKAIEKSCNLAMVFVPLCLSTHFMFVWMPVGLDFFFFIHFFILCCTLALLPKIGSKRMKAIAWIVIVVALFHAVNFRKNAILLVPIVAYVYVYAQHKVKGRKIVTFLRWTLITICFSVVSTSLVAWLFPVRHAHALSPMLASDMRIAAVLRGEQNQLFAKWLQDGARPKKVYHEYRDSLTAYWGEELLDKNDDLIPRVYETYINTWKTDPKGMLMSRMIQTVEFYCGGFFPPQGQPIIENLYPVLKTNPSTWHFLISQTPNVMYGRLAVLLAGMALVCSVCFRRKRNTGSIDTVDRQALLVCTAALIYAGSFVIVPPTADARYLAPSLFVIWNACWLWLASKIYHVVQGNKPSAEA